MMNTLVERWICHLVVKKGQSASECEDAVAANVDAGRFAIADGVSASLFAGEWARLLTSSFASADQPPLSPDDLHRWYLSMQKRWTEDIYEDWRKRFAAKGAEPPFNLQLKARHGSAATFLGLQLNQVAPNAENGGIVAHWRVIAVGDCCLLHIRGPNAINSFPISNSAQFGRTPAQLNSVAAAETAPDAQVAGGVCQAGDLLLLTTDAFAQGLLRLRERCPASDLHFANLMRVLFDKELFRWMVDRTRATKIVDNDDVGVILVEIKAEPSIDDDDQLNRGNRAMPSPSSMV